MQSIDFDDALRKIVERDPRYPRDAYLFLREALEYTQRTASKPKREEVRHVSGKELLDGIRRYAIEQYGPMTVTVFDAWGIRSCEDFGEIVFNLVDSNLLAKTENDSRDDFKGGYDFDSAFRKPFQPSKNSSAPQKKSVQT